jgi:micrococcal nuclease
VLYPAELRAPHLPAYSKNSAGSYSLGPRAGAAPAHKRWLRPRGNARLLDLLARHAWTRATVLLVAGLGAAVVASGVRAIEESALDLVWSEPLPVRAAIAGAELELADGRRVRLAGLRVPPEPIAGTALAGDAQALLADLIEGAAVRLGTTAAPYDRYGRLVAQIERADGLWLQGVLLERGLAQAWPRPGEAARAKEMLAIERTARAARRGLWAQARFAPRSAEQLDDEIGSFQIVQGRVREVSPERAFVYLNFGRDWWSDFTLRVDGELEEAFARSGRALPSLAGRRIEARGFVLQAGGPLIELSHPEQVQLLP